MTTDERQTWLAAYEEMLTIRRFEETVSRLVKQARLPGFAHLYIGVEASAVGVCGARRPGDLVFSNHRPHGHCLACGADPTDLFAELYGFREGLCRGKGGSMHIADLQHGFFGGNGIVGAGIALALGPALRAQHHGTDDVSIVFFGDGASNQGAFHEALNLAAVWKLPVLFVCENDGYAQATPREAHQTIDSVADRAGSYGMAGVSVDGQDVRDVRAAATTALARARSGSGPTLLECRTVRVSGHYEGDPINYKTPAEVAAIPDRDPIGLHAAYLTDTLGVDANALAEIGERVAARIATALAAAESGTLPDPEAALEDVFATPLGASS